MSAGMSTTSNCGANMTYARALNDAKSLIVQQSTRIKSDAQKINAQADEIAHLRCAADEMAAELDRLRKLEARLAEAAAGREQAEALVGRQRIEIDSLETASRELQRMLTELAARINDLTAEAEQLRAHVPTDEDAAALEQMTALLTIARAGAKSRHQRADQHTQAPTGRLDRMSGPALAREHHDRQQAQARKGAAAQEITIPADPTAFRIVTERRAA